jgi:galactofuranose transport system substrate-binding protein
VDYLLVSATKDSCWDTVLQTAKKAGVTVSLFDRLFATAISNYQAALVSGMAAEGQNAVNRLLSRKPPQRNLILIRG